VKFKSGEALSRDYSAPQIVVGDYSIAVDDKGVWIYRVKGKYIGEGGQFSEKKFADMVDAFYQGHF
jgi:hypothetical protein